MKFRLKDAPLYFTLGASALGLTACGASTPGELINGTNTPTPTLTNLEAIQATIDHDEIVLATAQAEATVIATLAAQQTKNAEAWAALGTPAPTSIAPALSPTSAPAPTAEAAETPTPTKAAGNSGEVVEGLSNENSDDFNNAVATAVAAEMKRIAEEQGKEEAEESGDTTAFTVEGSSEGFPGFEIIGAPISVDGEKLNSANNGKDSDGVDHKNTLGKATQFFIAEPGVYTTHDPNSKDIGVNGSAFLITPDIQENFEQEGPSDGLVFEGAYGMATAAGMNISFKVCTTGEKININLPAKEGHSWMVILKGCSRDQMIDTDYNNIVTFDNYTAGAILFTKLPPGQFVSEDYVRQNMDTVHTYKNCGVDGCTAMSLLTIDMATGAYTVNYQDSPTSNLKLIESNIK